VRAEGGRFASSHHVCLLITPLATAWESCPTPGSQAPQPEGGLKLSLGKRCENGQKEGAQRWGRILWLRFCREPWLLAINCLCRARRKQRHEKGYSLGGIRKQRSRGPEGVRSDRSADAQGSAGNRGKMGVHLAELPDEARQTGETFGLLGSGAGAPYRQLATVQGYPSLKDVLPKPPKEGSKKIYLIPFMSVVGEHARKRIWRAMSPRAGNLFGRGTAMIVKQCSRGPPHIRKWSQSGWITCAPPWRHGKAAKDEALGQVFMPWRNPVRLRGATRQDLYGYSRSR
jgi:hypothetical protein